MVGARCEPVEVGFWGFAGKSLHQTLKLLVVKGLQRRRAIKNILEAHDGCGSGGGIRGLVRITPGWVARERVYDD